MQEVKKLVRKLLRFLCAFLMGAIKRVLRAIPPLERASRAFLRGFPKLRTIYLRLMPPLQDYGADSVSRSSGGVPLAPSAPPRKRPLTPNAAVIFSDLKKVVPQNTQNNSSVGSAKADSVASPKGHV